MVQLIARPVYSGVNLISDELAELQNQRVTVSYILLLQLHLFIRIFWCEHFTKNISRYSYSQISCDLTLGSKLG